MSVYCPVLVSIVVWFVLCAWISRFQPLSLCHIARCQGQLVTMYGFRSGGSNGFSSIPLSPYHFHHPFYLALSLVLIVCLPDWGCILSHLCCFVFLYIFATSFCVQLLLFFFFLFFFFFSFFFCRMHLRSVSFSACLALVLVFRVSAYPSFLGRQWCFDLRSCSVEIKRKSVWSFVLSHHL